MRKRILIIWAIANFAIVGLVSWMAGWWHIGWHVSPVIGMLAELGLIMVPNLLLPILVLRYWWPEPVDSIRETLGWQWNDCCSLISGILTLVSIYVMIKVVVVLVGSSIPYNLPGATGGGIAIKEPLDVLKILGVLLGLLAFVIITIVGEETIFRGLIQTQTGRLYGVWPGLQVGVILFRLPHLPADLFYAQIW